MGCTPSRQVQVRDTPEWARARNTSVPRQPSGYEDPHTTNTIRYNEAAADCTNITGHRPKKSMTQDELARTMRRWRPGKLFIGVFVGCFGMMCISKITDKHFPIEHNSVLAVRDQHSGIRWKRPKELVSKPRLLVNGISRGDIQQGNLADCWFLSSCAAIAMNPRLMKRVIPHNYALCGDKYTGLLHFRFWRFGKWTDVYIDDRLPVDADNKLIYAKCQEANEFWVSLLEKALHGTYAALEGGQAMDALVDLTAGLAERYELAQAAPDLYQKLATARASDAFITCSRKGDWRIDSSAADEVGLIAGHAYTITDVKRIKRKHGHENLVRIRNPWGMGEEWKGAWSDKDDRWNLVDDATKKWLQFQAKEDGEFWMSYKDFLTHFQEVTICTLGPDFDGDGASEASGHILCARGAWRLGVSAGGCRNDLDLFATNPQFALTVHAPDDTNESVYSPEERPSSWHTCSVVIALMQEHRCTKKFDQQRATNGMRMLQIGFIIYKTKNPNVRLPLKHFMYNYETAKSGTYVNFREVCGRFELAPGHYIIIPSTYESNQPSSFLLRVFAKKRVTLKPLQEYIDDRPVDDYIPPRVVRGEDGRYEIHTTEEDYVE